MKGNPPAASRWGPFTISRSLEVLALVVVLLIVGVTAHQLLAGRALIIADTERQMARLDMVFAEQTGRAVEGVDLILRNAIDTLQSMRARGPVDARTYQDLLAGRTARVRQVSEIAITDAGGQVLYSSQPGTLTQLVPAAHALVLAQAKDPHLGLQFSEPFRGADGKWTALMLRPIVSSGGKFEGAALAFLNLSYFEDFYRAVELTENGAILLHLRDGTVLARYPHSDAVIGESYADLPPFKDILAHSMAGTVVMNSPIDGRPRVLAIRALKAFPLAVNVSVGESPVLASWRRQVWTFSLVALGASVAVVGLLLLLAQRSRQVEVLLGEYRAARDSAEEAQRRLIEQMAERERAEAALRQAQRIEAVGQLTGGVAHDFNNLLTVLIGNIELMRKTMTLDPATADRLEAMRGAAERGAMLTRGLLAFARRQPLSPRPVDLNAAIDSMQGLLHSALGPRMKIESRPNPDLWPAMIDPTQFELVILNLVINARDAMPSGGVVTIETDNTHRGPPANDDEPAEGDYIVVTVCDTGVGMTPEVQARAFEPFFTTKPPGAGSGLGLSQVFGTARQSGGGVHIDSTPGRGTAVSVYLPRAALRPAPIPARPDDAERLEGGRAVVLVVDDDAAVLGTTTAILQDIGYSVLQAESGKSALELLDIHRPIDLLLTDVVMTPMTGLELARYVEHLYPQLPVIFFSGYAGSAGLAGDGVRHRLIRKPFTPGDLRRQIEDALAETRSRAPAA
jgi:signal transduction histidine kinase/ActR/RegA family two-component response regulator